MWLLLTLFICGSQVYRSTEVLTSQVSTCSLTHVTASHQHFSAWKLSDIKIHKIHFRE